MELVTTPTLVDMKWNSSIFGCDARDSRHQNIQGSFFCMRPANERRRYILTSSLMAWVHTQNDPEYVYTSIFEIRNIIIVSLIISSTLFFIEDYVSTTHLQVLNIIIDISNPRQVIHVRN